MLAPSRDADGTGLRFGVDKGSSAARGPAVWVWAGAAAIALLAGCAVPEVPPEPVRPELVPGQIARLLPGNLPDRTGWSADIYAAFSTQHIAPTPQNLCAVLAVTEQESTFRADPAVPGLAQIAWKEIDHRAERAGVPKFMVRAALQLASPDGRSYSERIDAVKTERELSEIYEDFIAGVPLGTRMFARHNPVRTGGPMQVSIAFAEAHAAAHPYPFPVNGSVRREVFTRRGGMYFGIAHLLGYEAPYPEPLYRFADFNAGQYASRNAAFQSALSRLANTPLVLDGDLLPPRAQGDGAAGETERAAVALSPRLNMSAASIRRDLEQGEAAGFERTRLYARVFELADQADGRRVARAVVPTITLKSPKFTRKLTTEWFARRVDERYRRCLAKAQAPLAG
jgi:hypothetical protein